MSFDRTIRVPRIGIYLPSHWCDQETLYVVSRLAYHEDAKTLHKVLSENGYTPDEICVHVCDVVDGNESKIHIYFDFIFVLSGEEAHKVWHAGEDCDGDYPVMTSLADCLR